MISTRLMGGLGNFLFQISAAYALSLREKQEFICDISDEQSPHNSTKTYIDNIFSRVKFTNKPLNLPIYGETKFNYVPIPSPNPNLKLSGYFQSEKYFEDYKEEIKNLFKNTTLEQKYLKEKYGSILEKNTVSIHVRRGDYLHLNYYHANLSMDYYNKAISHFDSNMCYLIFSDDINWCEENFSFLNEKYFIKENKDYQDLYLMSMCKNNIMANSTFSWWGSWLNSNSGITISPSKWFGPGYQTYETKDLYCKNWIII